MIMMVLRFFPGYNLSTIQDVPYCHFLELFSMAENMDNLCALTILTADDAKYDKNTLAKLRKVECSRFKSEKVYKRIVTEDAKRKIEQLYTGM